MSRWLAGLIVGLVLGLAFALVTHYAHSTGCSVRQLKSGGTVQTCGDRGDLAALLVPSLLVGAGLGGAVGLLASRREG